MAKRKVIGIPGYINTKAESFGVGVSYASWLSKFGDIRVISPHEDPKVVSNEIDLLVLTGGADLRPDVYGATPAFRTGHQDPIKQAFFDHKLDDYIGSGVPIFGICLGFQMLAVKFGCKLEQDLLFHPTSSDRYMEGHKVTFLTGEEMPVNSHHHQAVLAEGFDNSQLEYMAYFQDPMHGFVIEAIRSLKHPNIVGVQWHPEEWQDEFSENLVKELLKLES